MLEMAQVRRVLLGPASMAMLGPLLATNTVPLLRVQCALPPCAWGRIHEIPPGIAHQEEQLATSS